MDMNSLKDTVSNLTLYDLKAGVRKVQNAVMNYTEMEAKVREATNNEPWGASSTLMQEIANGTQLLNEIMPMIYKRFTEKSAEEWRQIYKALQLLEFLIKNGSERVIDDARSHLSLLKMLRQFHFIDQNGKDQGVNVRNRSKELAELLSDVDRIRAERKKARSTRNKYSGVEGGIGSGGGFSGGSESRYGGFGSEDAGGYGGYSGGVYGDGGGFSGNSGGFHDSGNGSRRDRFEEYDEYSEGATAPQTRRTAASSAGATVRQESVAKTQSPKREPEADLFSFGDDASAAQAATSSANGKKPAQRILDDGFGTLQSGGADDDDFDDFQSASPSTSQKSTQASFQALPSPNSTSTIPSITQFAAPKPVSGSRGANLNDLVGFSSISPAPSQGSTTPSNNSSFAPPPIAQQPRPTGYQGTQPNYFTSVSVPPTQPHPGTLVNIPTSGVLPPSASQSAKPASSSSDAFGSLWSTASAGIKKTGTPTQGNQNLASLAKQKASAGIWGATPSSSAQQQQQRPTPQSGGQKIGGGLDDLLG
ncbi:MAG: Epsin-3, clathrin recruitment and traffic between the Golgi and endosome [Geoglossum umbratile]|nr:MAG: Epsin-3, clathrin recruitment and traffic between the Golgi and endosome [Geoglossum umbratile]